MLEGDGHVVKKAIARLGYGHQGAADDANIIEEEYGMIFVGNDSGFGASASTSVVDGMEAMEHFYSFPGMEC